MSQLSRDPIYGVECSDEDYDRLTKSNVFCIIPWIHLHGWPDGRAYPCCMGEMDYPVGDLQTNTMKEVWNQDPLKKMRYNMLRELPCNECSRCYETEAHGGFSMRNSMNQHFGQHIGLIHETRHDGYLDRFELKYYDIRFSNLCNMKCRTCGHILSSGWVKDTKTMSNGNPVVDYKGVPLPANGVMYAGRHENDMMEQLEEHLPHLEQIYFAGGEPLIMPEHFKIIDELVKRKMFHVRLLYNTNLSTVNYKDHNILERWKLFDVVGVGASLDAEGARGEYMRKGVPWAHIVHNREQMLKVCPDVDFYVSSTVSAYNVIHLVDFHRSWVSKGLIKPHEWDINILQSPLRDRVDILPQPFKEVAIEKITSHLEWLEPLDHVGRATSGYRSILSYLQGDDNTGLIKDFVKFNDKVDEIRGEKFDSVFPELRGLRTYAK